MAPVTSSFSSLTDDNSAISLKRADRRKTINVFVLGDESVGKSSLISTFVSRHFSDSVPGIMTRVCLPPDPETSCVTTIIDSQGGDVGLAEVLAAKNASSEKTSPSSSSSSVLSESLAALLDRAERSLQQSHTTSSNASASSGGKSNGVESANSIVLVYDLNNEDTFHRLQSHWLPLIEQCYNGKVPVIIAENKVDMFKPASVSPGISEEQALARKRQQIVSMMQRFPFVRQCIKCSAKNLLRMDDIFLKAQQSVLYPFTAPLYDLQNGRLTVECKRVLTRIFRMYDYDRDNLLSDAELDRFQRDTYQVAVFDRDYATWKKVVVRNNTTDEDVVKDNKFTVAGFITIFDVFITQNRLDMVWRALRKFGYDDELNLYIPEHVVNPGSDATSPSSGKLTTSAKRFLTSLFHQFDGDKDGTITPEEMHEIFSILPSPSLPPWNPLRASELFKGCPSIPRDVSYREISESSIPYSDSLIVPGSMSQTISQSGISVLTAGDSLPTINMGGSYFEPRPITYLEWMGYWHTMSSISPSVTKTELYRLGYIEPRKSGSKSSRGRRKIASLPAEALPDAALDARVIRVLVLGSQSSGKTALLSSLCGMESSLNTVSPKRPFRGANHPESCCASIKISRDMTATSNTQGQDSKGSDLVANLIYTDVPETAAESYGSYLQNLTELFGSTASPKDRGCDIAMLVFDSTKASSLAYVKELESSLLTKDTPRVYVATKADLLEKSGKLDEATISPVLEAAKQHCLSLDLEPPLITSASSNTTHDNIVPHEKMLQAVACSVLEEPGIRHLKSRPFEERERQDAARRRNMWRNVARVVVAAGVVVAVGMGFAWASGSSQKKSSNKGFWSSVKLGWWRSC